MGEAAQDRLAAPLKTQSQVSPLISGERRAANQQPAVRRGVAILCRAARLARSLVGLLAQAQTGAEGTSGSRRRPRKYGARSGELAVVRPWFSPSPLGAVAHRATETGWRLKNGRRKRVPLNPVSRGREGAEVAPLEEDCLRLGEGEWAPACLRSLDEVPGELRRVS